MTKRDRLTISINKGSVAADLLEEVRRELCEENMAAALRTLVTTTAPLFLTNLRAIKSGNHGQSTTANSSQSTPLAANASHLNTMPANGDDNGSHLPPESANHSESQPMAVQESEAGKAFKGLLDF
ncbi:MAG: hypothetical protein F6J89_13725 [Symploca sp. SIO1C4]|uniref:Uncharacterized protein n=1 Tax=Symploca sp. SIO1C4 TaxID=2607765 RepID=A0A6B3NF28_9CYAN|nr:hypothetical protein [Symploca sp. SIO1C4]